MTPKLIISLDFEMFWGVADSRTIENYGRNIEGVWEAVPQILNTFKRYEVSATWATVGMLMCRNYSQWADIQPDVLPTYIRTNSSTYRLSHIVRENPNLFFARPLVERILETKGQELGSHTYSHFFCAEPGVDEAAFAADCACQKYIFSEFDLSPTTLVLPRNQIDEKFMSVATANGIVGFRGNQNHWFYRNGHFVPFGYFGRSLRKIDGYVSISGDHISYLETQDDDLRCSAINIPASMFLRPASNSSFLDNTHIKRIKAGMEIAAKTGGVFHLWWHPHNFGVNIERNINNLERLLQFYSVLADEYGMKSVSMANAVEPNTLPDVEGDV